MPIHRLGIVVLLAGAAFATAQSPPRAAPKLDPVAETKLLMQGLAHPNFKGLERILDKTPQENQAWTFGRGQALLLAETANLLMMRPPQKQGQDAWFERTAEMRTEATHLATNLGLKNYARSRAGLLAVAASCNRCHQTFRVNVQIAPFADERPTFKL